MKSPLVRGTCIAAALAIGTVVFAQNTPPTQVPSQPPTPQAAPPSQDQANAENVTLTACVQREDDYRRANNLGKGGAVGTGVGADNEFVLVNVTIGTPSGTVGTAGTNPPAAAPLAYEATGANENQLAAFVGKRVSVVGMLKKAETGPAGTTGGVTAAPPPTGVDVVSKDLKLREIEITSVTEATGTCSAGPAK